MKKPTHTKVGEVRPEYAEALAMRKLGSSRPVPTKIQGRRLLITVTNPCVLQGKIYKTDNYVEIPSVRTLRKIGVDYEPRQGDILTIDEVSPELWKTSTGTWVRI